MVAMQQKFLVFLEILISERRNPVCCTGSLFYLFSSFLFNVTALQRFCHLSHFPSVNPSKSKRFHNVLVTLYIIFLTELVCCPNRFILVMLRPILKHLAR